MVENKQSSEEFRHYVDTLSFKELIKKLDETNPDENPEQHRIMRERLEELKEIRSGLFGKKDSPQAYPSFINAIFLLFLLIATQLAVVWLIRAIVDTFGWKSAFSGPIAIGIGNIIAFGVVLWAGLPQTTHPGGEVLGIRTFSLSFLWPSLAALIGLSIVLSEIDNIIRRFLPPPEELSEAMQQLLQGGPLALIVLIVIAPLTEELFFRGLLLDGFARNYGAQKAMVFTALLFAAIHLNPYQFVPAFLIGLLLAWLRLKTGSIWLPITLHAANNALPFLFLRTRLPGTLQGQGEMQPLWLDGIGLALLGIGLIVLMRLTPNNRESASSPSQGHRRFSETAG
jgi:uncharacterized protein